MGKWPQLVLHQFCHTEISVKVDSEELNENGTPKQLIDWEGKCNYQDKVTRTWNKDRELVKVSAICLIPGDIAPGVSIIPSGTVTVFGQQRELIIGRKVRNPDGTVNYTQLELR